MGIDQLACEVLMLGAQDRAVLAETIWESLDDPFVLSTDLSEEKALALARQRDQELDRGDVVPLSHQTLRERLRP